MYLTPKIVCWICKIWGKRLIKLSYITFSSNFLNKPPLECPKLNKPPGLNRAFTVCKFLERRWRYYNFRSLYFEHMFWLLLKKSGERIWFDRTNVHTFWTDDCPKDGSLEFFTMIICVTLNLHRFDWQISSIPQRILVKIPRCHLERNLPLKDL